MACNKNTIYILDFENQSFDVQKLFIFYIQPFNKNTTFKWLNQALFGDCDATIR